MKPLCSRRVAAIIEALLATIIWASSFVLVKMILPDIGPLTIAGLRYFLASLAIFSLYAHWYFTKYRTTTLFLAASLLLAIMLNWVRVFTVIVAGHLTNMQHFLIHDHADFGWWLFVLIVIPLFIFGNYLQKRELQKII